MLFLKTIYNHSTIITPKNSLNLRSTFQAKAISLRLVEQIGRRLTTLVTNSSWMDSSTNNRPAAIQFSPLLKNTAPMPFSSRGEKIVNAACKVKIATKWRVRCYWKTADNTVWSQKNAVSPLASFVMAAAWRYSFDLVCF